MEAFFLIWVISNTIMSISVSTTAQVQDSNFKIQAPQPCVYAPPCFTSYKQLASCSKKSKSFSYLFISAPCKREQMKKKSEASANCLPILVKILLGAPESPIKTPLGSPLFSHLSWDKNQAIMLRVFKFRVIVVLSETESRDVRNPPEK